MRKIYLSLISSVLLSANAQTYEMPSLGDAQINFNQACPTWQTVNNADVPLMTIGEWTWFSLGCGQGTLRGLYQFDLNVPAAHNQLYDKRASLKLFFPVGSNETHFYTGGATGNEFIVERLTSPWDEQTVTWANQPESTTANAILVPSSSTNPSTEDYNIDISPIINEWLCAGVINYGIILKVLNEGAIYRRLSFATKEWSDATKHPLLQLEYAQITASGPNQVCQGEVLQLQTIIENAANIDEYEFSWQYINQGTILQGASHELIINETGVHTFVLHANNGNCQSASDTLRIEVGNAASAINISADADFICPGQTLQLSIDPNFENAIWSNGNTGNSIEISEAGIYQVNASLVGNCLSSGQIEIQSGTTQAIEIFAENNGILCPGAQLTLTAIGNFDEFIWSNGASGTSISVSDTGSYSVMGIAQLTCNMQSPAIQISISSALPALVLAPSGTSVCEGSELPLFAQQGLSNVVWQDNSIGLTHLATQEAWYYYQAENEQGCQIISDSIYISISPLPEAGFDYMQQSGNYAVDFSAINPDGASVNWIFHNGEQASGEEVSHTYPFEGFYVVTVIFKNQCGNDTLTQTIEVEKLLSVKNLSWQIAVYPNPFQEYFIINLSEDLIAARLYDLQGRALPLNIEVVENSWHIQTPKIAKGMYLLALEFRNQIYYHKLYKD